MKSELNTLLTMLLEHPEQAENLVAEIKTNYSPIIKAIYPEIKNIIKTVAHDTSLGIADLNIEIYKKYLQNSHPDAALALTLAHMGFVKEMVSNIKFN